MSSRWKIGTIAACIVAVGAAVTIRQLHNRRDTERKLAEAAHACRVLAEQGDAAAQARLAYMYSHGQGVQLNYDEAANWYRKSADQGNPNGETGIGYMYYTGEGVARDFAEAARWFRKAADQGYSRAEVDLGDMYYSGYTFPQNYAEAARWYRKAADQSDARAQYDLGWMYYYGKGLLQGRTVSDWWYHNAAANGNVDAQRILGLRGSGLSTCGKIFVATIALACFLLFGAYFGPATSATIPGNRLTLVSGILLLILLALQLFGSFHGIPRDPTYIPILFHSIFGFVIGMSVTTNLSIVWRRGPGRLLVISCIWFVAANLIVVAICFHEAGHIVSLRTFSEIPAIYGTEAAPIGMAIPAAILLWLSGRRGQGPYTSKFSTSSLATNSPE